MNLQPQGQDRTDSQQRGVQEHATVARSDDEDQNPAHRIPCDRICTSDGTGDALRREHFFGGQ